MINPASRIYQVEEYYFSRKLAEVRSLDRPGNPVINLGIGSPDMAPPAATIQALTQSAQVESNHGYQNYKGIPALRSAIASYYKSTYSVGLDAETEILPLMGSKEGIFHISMAFVNEGDQVLIPDPGYPTYASAARLVGGEVRTYVMKESMGWKIDIDELERQDLSRVKIMWINFPHMPTGSVATHEELSALVALARRQNFLLVNDNPYSRILNDSPISVLAVPGAAETALELNSLSKSHNMAGWRIGWVAGRREYIDAVLRVKSNLDSGMFLSLQHAAVEALKSGPDWFEKINAEYKRRRETALEILRELECTTEHKQSGLFLWAKAPSRITDVEAWVDEILYGAGVFVTPGSVFGAGGQRHLRVALCAPDEKLQEALRRIRHWNKGDSPISPGLPAEAPIAIGAKAGEGSGVRPAKEKMKAI
jgi:aspartate/methionine/tyrosine aminotransferase